MMMMHTIHAHDTSRDQAPTAAPKKQRRTEGKYRKAVDAFKRSELEASSASESASIATEVSTELRTHSTSVAARVSCLTPHHHGAPA